MTGNSEITIEVCKCTEWLRSNCLGVTGTDADDAANELSNRVLVGLLDAGYQTTHPHGQRILFHGWNGARWRWRYGPAGTFDQVTDVQKSQIMAIVDAAEASVRADFAEELAE